MGAARENASYAEAGKALKFKYGSDGEYLEVKE